MSFRKLAFFFLCLSPHVASGALPVGKPPAEQVTLSGKEGGRLDGKAWTSSELKGKVHMLVYSAPSAKDLNNNATEAVKKAVDAGEIPRSHFASVAVVNMAASIWPNWMISNAIEKKQKRYPDTVYVKDINKTLVKKWDMRDESNSITIFDSSGNVVFSMDGELKARQITDLVAAIKGSLPKNSTSPKIQPKVKVSPAA